MIETKCKFGSLTSDGTISMVKVKVRQIEIKGQRHESPTVPLTVQLIVMVKVHIFTLSSEVKVKVT